MSVFRFKEFSVRNESSAMKLGTDSVVLGASITLRPSDRFLLDVGTGTGVVALLAAQRLSEMGADFRIEGIDIDGPSVEEASFNFSASPWSVSLSSAEKPLSAYEPGGKIDCIFSNPPYYDESLKNPDARLSAARHTSSLSYRELCSFAADYLSAEGRLSMILPSDCRRELLRTAASFGLKPFRIVSVRTSSRKKPLRMVAEFCRERFFASTAEEELDLQGPNCTSNYLLERNKTLLPIG